MDPQLIIAFLILGSATGFVAGLLGIGGGLILVPFITAFLETQAIPKELIIHIAIATSLATIMFTSLASMRAHHRHGAVQWQIVKLLAPGILLGSWCGSWLGASISSVGLTIFFVTFVVFTATQLLLDKKPKASRALPQTTGMLGMGSVIGIFSGLVGAGGGVISVPFMIWCNVKVRQAVATSAALGFPIALAGTLSNIYHGLQVAELPHGSLGFVYLPALMIIVIASMTTAPLGARAAHTLPVKLLKRLFALMLYGLAAYMLQRGIFA